MSLLSITTLQAVSSRIIFEFFRLLVQIFWLFTHLSSSACSYFALNLVVSVVDFSTSISSVEQFLLQMLLCSALVSIIFGFVRTHAHTHYRHCFQLQLLSTLSCLCTFRLRKNTEFLKYSIFALLSVEVKACKLYSEFIIVERSEVELSQ